MFSILDTNKYASVLPQLLRFDAQLVLEASERLYNELFTNFHVMAGNNPVIESFQQLCDFVIPIVPEPHRIF